MKRVLEYQGLSIKMNILFQDNMSRIKLANNCKNSTGKRARHCNLKYFDTTDLIERNEKKISYCPTEDMIADIMTKPVIGEKFKRLRSKLMNHVSSANRSVLEE